MNKSVWLLAGAMASQALWAQGIAELDQPVPAYIERLAGSAAIHAIYAGSGIPKSSEGATWREVGMRGKSGLAIRNVTLPTVTVFKPAAGKANGTAMIIAPGGGWRQLMMGYEGADMAGWLTERGVTAFVLRYRLAHIPEANKDVAPYFLELAKIMPKGDLRTGKTRKIDPEGEAARTMGDEDGEMAVRFVRKHAAHFGVDPNKIGIAGFSAGGGVVMGTVFSEAAESRPNFAVPVYGAYRMAPVPPNAPPLFIVMGNNDQSVPPMMASHLYETWHEAGRPVELHIFQNAAHGFGMNKWNQPSDRWLELLEGWMQSLGFIAKK